MSLCLVMLIGTVSGTPTSGEGEWLPVAVREGDIWQIGATGNCEAWIDRRELLVLFHSWDESKAGASVTATCEVVIPADWPGATRMHFYMTDDYDGLSDPLEEGWLGQANLVGHRFKQVLIDDQVVWERDVADAEGVAQPSRFSVVLPERIKPGDRVRVGFRLIDRVGTGTRLPDDRRYIGTTDGIQDTDPWKFMTHVYVGDVVLSPEGVSSITEGAAPSAERVRNRLSQHGPMKPCGEGVKFPVTLSVQGGGLGTDRILHCGVPLPPGTVRDVGQVVLSNEAGKSLSLQSVPMNYWPDGSVRWVEVNTILPGGTDRVRLDLLEESVSGTQPLVQEPVAVTRGGSGEVRIETGQTQVVAGGSDGTLIRSFKNGSATVENLAGRLEMGERVYVTEVESVDVLADGPIRAEVELSGKLISGASELGRFVFRVSAFAGQPYVRLTWRTFNDLPKTPNISRVELTAACSWSRGVASHWGDPEKRASGEITLRQLRENAFEVVDPSGQVLDAGEACGGWLGLSDGGKSLCVLVRHFREQYPKALTFQNGRLRIALFEPCEQEPHYTPNEGEAKRHEIWLGLWETGLGPSEFGGISEYFACPPRVFDADYFCASGGLGPAFPHDEERFPELTSFMTNTYGEIEAHRFYRNGIRNWGDAVYNADKEQWCNGYYDRQQGFAVEYLITGDPRWFDRLEATVRHIIDVDVCHRSEAHPEWVGGIHGYYGRDHSTEAPWNPIQRTKGTLAYWRFTADTDARDAALAVADSAIAANRGIGARSVRDHAGILYCLTAAYDETRDRKYLEGARRVAHDAIGRIDKRRGCYAEVHGNLSYRGNVPWMVAQLAEPMYDYYRQSGDVDAAVAVVGLAESIIAENCTRGVPGDVYGYSHNPHFKKTSGYHILIAPTIMYAYELTGDPQFLTHAEAMYEQTIREGTVNSIVNCYWNTHTLLYYLNRYGHDEETTP